MNPRTGVTMHWTVHAACKGMPTGWFYGPGTRSRWRSGRPPAKGEPLEVRPEVKAACARCPVRNECLNHALEHWEMGWWGGTSEEQRRIMRPDGTARHRLEAHMARFEFPPTEEARRKQQQRQREDAKFRNQRKAT